jgi:uncharacterized protein YndB with AHSA1/START domain
MSFRVSTHPDGRKLWWKEDEAIPEDHVRVRPATAEETLIMEQIVRGGGGPVTRGKRLARLMDQTA